MKENNIQKVRESNTKDKYQVFLILLILAIYTDIRFTIPAIKDIFGCTSNCEGAVVALVFLPIPLALNIATIIVGIHSFKRTKENKRKND